MKKRFSPSMIATLVLGDLVATIMVALGVHAIFVAPGEALVALLNDTFFAWLCLVLGVAGLYLCGYQLFRLLRASNR